MMRYFYSVSLLLVGLGLPVLAKTDAPLSSAPPHSSKGGIKTAVLPTPAPTVSAKDQSPSPKAKAKAVAAVAPQVPPSFERPLGSPILGNRLVAFSAPKSFSPPAYQTDRTEDAGRTAAGGRLARVTAYWASEGDYYTDKLISATGVRLHDGHCAVDPTIIPYGSIVEIAGVGKFLAVDTGSAVISRAAAREGGHTSAERRAIVVDLFFANRAAGERFAAGSAKFVSISWWTPRSADTQARARSLFAEEDWTKIQSKQL
jgi:3D (Asp-Asp-Asp) domain-containing protein